MKQGSFVPVLENLWLYRDLCNVYCLVQENHALCFDLGTGAVLDHLADIGVDKVDQVLLTHCDRDQLIGWPKAQARGIPILAPSSPNGTPLTHQEIERYWRSTAPLSNSATFFNVLPIPPQGVSQSVGEGTLLQWRGSPVIAHHTPGHTPEHTTYLTYLKGKTVLFSGDLLWGPGRVWKGYQLDWDHWLAQGQELARQSLERVASLKPDLLCPSHGEVLLQEGVSALLSTAEKMAQLARYKSFTAFALEKHPHLKPPQHLPPQKTYPLKGGGELWQISDHLWAYSNCYFLLSHTGEVLVVDSQAPEKWEEILAIINARKISVLFITHAHSDHTERVKEAQERFHCEVWAQKEMASLLAHPLDYWHPFNNWEPFTPTRLLCDGEELFWQEYTFRAYFLPGQTYFHGGLETQVDGHRVFFTGDTFQPRDIWNGTGGWMGLNRGFPLYHAQSAEKILKRRPHWILPGHCHPFLFDKEDFRCRIEWGKTTANLLDSLSPSGNHFVDFNPHILSCRPYVVELKDNTPTEVHLINEAHLEGELFFNLQSPPFLTVEPSEGTLLLSSSGGPCQRFLLWKKGTLPERVPLAIDLWKEGSYWGTTFFLVQPSK